MTTPASPFHLDDDDLWVYPIVGILGTFHLLYQRSTREAVLLDTGLVGEMPQLQRLLVKLGLSWSDLKAILLTHGHLDHTGNLTALKKLSNAPVWAHPAEQSRINGKFPYPGLSKWCGRLEAAGRWLLRYRGTAIDEPLHDGQILPFWGGLQVIHLPGHTEGHCAFFSQKLNLLFSGDLFASYAYSCHLPPPFLNSCPQHFPTTLRKVQDLSPKWVIPNHYSAFDPSLHQQRLTQLIQIKL